MRQELLLAITTLMVGWIALAPVARRLGALGYHISAMPVGLLAWVGPASVAIAVHQRYGVVTTVAGLGLFVGLVWAGAIPAARHDAARSARVPVWTFPLVAGVLLTFTAIMTRWGISAYSLDGWAQYEFLSYPLSDKGEVALRLLAERMILLPSIHAGFHMFGGEFTYILYPILSLTLAAVVGAALWWAGRTLRTGARIAVTVTILVAMIGHVSYLFFSVYMHSHTVTALYLLLAVVGVERATVGVRRAADGLSAEVSRCWLLVSGLSMLGLLLGRPDGPPYVFVPLLTAIAFLMWLGVSPKSYDLLFAPMVLGLVIYAVATVLARGEFWVTHKMTAGMLLWFAALFAALWGFLRFLSIHTLEWLRTGMNAPRFIIGIEAAALTVLFVAIPDRINLMLVNNVTNLWDTGGWRSLWAFLPAYAVLALTVRPRAGRERFRAYVGFAIVQFFVVAFIVHGTSHVGRIGWGDSFNRVAFHVVPLIYLYVGYYAVELLKATGARRASLPEAE